MTHNVADVDWDVCHHPWGPRNSKESRVRAIRLMQPFIIIHWHHEERTHEDTWGHIYSSMRTHEYICVILCVVCTMCTTHVFYICRHTRLLYATIYVCTHVLYIYFIYVHVHDSHYPTKIYIVRLYVYYYVCSLYMYYYACAYRLKHKYGVILHIYTHTYMNTYVHIHTYRPIHTHAYICTYI
jgi:hypothetical protein